MPAYASIEVASVPLSRPSVLVGVYRYRPLILPKYQYLSNVKVLGIQCHEGPDPGSARFRYVFNSSNPATDPVSFQEALSVDSDLSGVVKNDERLVVRAYNPDGSTRILFDGFAQVPELSLSCSQELVTFLAFGVAVREWDTPIGGAFMRNADEPVTGTDVETDLVTQFNPDGQPNATPEGANAKDKAGNAYPTFLDSLVLRNPDLRRYWSLPMAARYLCYRYNPNQTYVQNPKGSLLDALLDSRAPSAGVTFQPSDPNTYQSQSLLVSDYPLTGKAWPIALHELLEPNGFGMTFRLETDDNGDPITNLEVFRRQDGSSHTFKDLFLQLAGSPLDPAQSNLTQAQLVRDQSGVANTFLVDSELVRYEASFVLSPGFPIRAEDAANATMLKNFDKNDSLFSQMNRDKYRFYVFDETGEGHWDFGSSSTVSTVPSLTDLLGGDQLNPGLYVKRRRPPLGELFSVDSNRMPLRARLAIATDYNGPQPGLWDGTGTWQPVLGGFDLLKDRLGIWINGPNPNSWNVGASNRSEVPYPAGIVKGVEDQANLGAKHFALRLTCVIEGDHVLAAKANQRPSSSTSFAVTRRIDARDRYFKHIVASNSEFNSTSTAVAIRDDSADAQSEANSRRLAQEIGEVAGSATIPRFTDAYRIGDKICSIQGRNLSLRTNAGSPSQEGAVFPSVVGLSWEFGDRQRTVLQLSDHRSELR